MYPRYPNKRGQCGLPKWPNCCTAILEHKPHENRGKRTSVENVLMKKGDFTQTVTWLRNLKIFKCEETLINVARRNERLLRKNMVLSLKANQRSGMVIHWQGVKERKSTWLLASDQSSIIIRENIYFWGEKSTVLEFALNNSYICIIFLLLLSC